MIIGLPKEIKVQEYRVALSPIQIRELVNHGHRVLVENNAGLGSGFEDESYQKAGAELVATAEAVFTAADLVVKVKEPQPRECAMLREGQVLFTFLHLAPDSELTDRLLDSGVTAIAYETVRDKAGRLPLLFPMSEIAGRLSAQAAAYCLEKQRGGAGLLLAGATGVEPAEVLVLGGGVVGVNAASIAAGMGAKVCIAEYSPERRTQLSKDFGSQIEIIPSEAISSKLSSAAVVIGAALVPGDTSPKLIKRSDLPNMMPGAVLVDVAIDQGGCFDTSRPTTHDAPTFIEHGIVHYCVANIPGAVPRTSTAALAHATFPYVLKLADLGWQQALREDAGFAVGLNTHAGKLYCAAVAHAQGRSCSDMSEIM